ncbi:MAG: glycoside hydrolase family 32 protein, partial [Lachnospiraceae bacterium]|nr:glycoside hydrolase family 32 protein [Lachnospiraceae bacterium]
MNLRPEVHFTPKYGWINDPNGLVFYKGQYHIFFQHNPHGLVWDSMHWGHAVSEDLMHWKELPIALYPDEMGDIFSGSCFYDAGNISGLGSMENPPLLAFYTAHHPVTKREQQCLAYSLDGLCFEKYEGNPIIKGFDHTPARDPHVFANPTKGGFSMCITREDRILFYHSADLLFWEQTGEFYLPEYAFHGMIECPCMVFLNVEGQ